VCCHCRRFASPGAAAQAYKTLHLLGGAELQRHFARRCFGDCIEVVQDAGRPVQARVPQELAQRPAKQSPQCLALSVFSAGKRCERMQQSSCRASARTSTWTLLCRTRATSFLSLINANNHCVQVLQLLRAGMEASSDDMPQRQAWAYT